MFENIENDVASDLSLGRQIALEREKLRMQIWIETYRSFRRSRDRDDAIRFANDEAKAFDQYRHAED